MLLRSGFFSVLLFCFSKIILGQDTIYLQNPSFEDAARKGNSFSTPIVGWTDCGQINFPGQSPPDILPTPDSAWGVTLAPKDGLTYLAMATRFDETYESVSQSLSAPLHAGKCYRLSGYFALSETYQSRTARSGGGGTPVILKGKNNKEVSWTYWLKHDDKNLSIEGKTPGLEDFSHPVELLIWGGYEDCKRNQLYVHSGLVSSNQWTPFTLEFTPVGEHDHITLGAFFAYGYTEPYNGHLLIDGLSPIVEVECK